MSVAMVDNSQDQESMPPAVKRKLSTNSPAMMHRHSISVSNGTDKTSNEDHWYVTTAGKPAASDKYLHSQLSHATAASDPQTSD
jgi:hypothetical protein